MGTVRGLEAEVEAFPVRKMTYFLCNVEREDIFLVENIHFEESVQDVKVNCETR